MGSETRTSYSHAFVLRCADDKLLAIHVGGPDRLWQALCAAVDDPSIGGEPLFQKRHNRIANYDKLINAMRPVFMKRPRAEWLKRLADHDVASAEINTIGEAVGDAEVAHLGLFEKQQRPGYGEMTMLRRAPRINGAREPKQKMPPLLGEHTQAVLKRIRLRRSRACDAARAEDYLADVVIARSAKRDEAKSSSARAGLDCFASPAMTVC